MRHRPIKHRRAFTLIELLVVVAIVALLISIMLPALTSAREAARTTKCMSNQRQIVAAWTMHADDHDARPMPHRALATSERVYWYGREDTSTNTIDHHAGLLTPYLSATPGDRSVFECPAQRDGTYKRQGQTDTFTTTYGYNAYALAPSTSGYAPLTGVRAPRLHQIERPARLLVFADSLIYLFGAQPSNSALLDPPVLYSGRGRWSENFSPTTAFRHGVDAVAGFGTAVNARADGSVQTSDHDPSAMSVPEHAIGSISAENTPHYLEHPERYE